MIRHTALHRILRRRPGFTNTTSRVNGTGKNTDDQEKRIPR